MLNKNLFTLLSCLLLTGCGMIDYHPYDVRISGETDVNAHNIEQIETDCNPLCHYGRLTTVVR